MDNNLNEQESSIPFSLESLKESKVIKTFIKPQKLGL